MNECEKVRRSYSSVVGISSEVFRVVLGVFLPLRGFVIHRVLQAVPVFVLDGAIARLRVPRVPALVQVLENGQVTIKGCVSTKIKDCARAHVFNPSTVVLLSRPLQQSNTPPGSSPVAYVCRVRSFTKKSNHSLVG